MEVATVQTPPEKRWWQAILRWQYLGLTLLVIATLALHFAIITTPAEPLFDEQHYVPDARSIIQGQGTLRPEHPPLGKLFNVAGILLFGDNPVGWRFFPVLFGTISIVLFYFICRRLSMSPRATFLATFLLAFENLTFLQASVAMLDVYSLTFVFAGFLLYLQNRFVPAGIAVGLSALAKLYGGLAIIAMILHWAFARRENPKGMFMAMAASGVSFLAFMPLFDFIISGHLQNPISQTLNMLSLSGSLTFATVHHDAASRPWEWIILPRIMPYWYTPQYIAAISFTLWALIIPAVVFMFIRGRKGSNASTFGLAWFAATYLVWIPLSLITNRISFLFYFYPTVGAIAIGIGLGLYELLDKTRTSWIKRKRGITGAVAGYLALHLAILIILSPLATGIIKWY